MTEVKEGLEINERNKGELPHGKLKAGVVAIEPVVADLSLVSPLTKTCFLNTANDHTLWWPWKHRRYSVHIHPPSKKYFVILSTT